MCQLCGCQQFIKDGQKAVIKRVTEIVTELQLTPANVDDYECTETISGFFAPFGSKEDEIYKAASWISGLHEGRRKEQYQSHLAAFRDIFSRLPVRGDPKHIATSFHQIEQLARELDEEALASLKSELREAIEAVNRVHDDNTRTARLRERYNL
ncbi:MAG: hypothetical protein Q8O55_07080 [Dehalococcoidales bacterium]|nr:hypothetical protein [Dehalococcoidales bacterium]